MNGNGTVSKMDKETEEVEAMMPKPGWGDKNGSAVTQPVKHSVGVGKFRPKTLQKCGGIWSFTFLFGFSSLLTASLREYMKSQFMFIERQYGLTSATTGLLVSCSDIGFLMVVLIFSYFGRKWNIPRVLAISSFVFGVAAIICALPAAKQDDLVAPTKVKLEDALSIEKLFLDIPACFMKEMSPETMQKMMKMMMDSKAKPKPKMKPITQKPKPLTAKPVTPAPTPAPTVAPTTEAPKPVDTERPIEDKTATAKPTQPAPQTTTSTTTTTTEAPVDEGPPIQMPDFAKLQTHPMYSMIKVGATAAGIDMDVVNGFKTLPEQVAYFKTLDPAVAEQLPMLKAILGANAEDYFILVSPSGKLIPKSRRKRDANKEDKDWFIDITTNLMWSGQLSMMVKNMRPFTDSQIEQMTAMFCPFNTGPFHTDSNTASFFFALITVGMVLQGIARAPQAAFSTVYVDDAVKDTRTGLHLGMIYSSTYFGKLFAGGIGFMAMSNYFTLEDVGHMTFLNARYLSAWWIGFVVYGLLALVLAAVLLSFPKTLARAESEHINNNTAAIKNISRITQESKGFLRALFRLLINPLFLLIVLGNAATELAASGYAVHLTKYIETQFSVPMLQEGIIVPMLLTLVGVIGTFIGGYLTSKLRMTPLTCLKVTAALAVLVAVAHSANIGLGCDQPIEDKGEKMMTNTSQTLCSNTCVCVDAMHAPVCGSDGNTYFSPCHAGCALSYDGHYHDCKCVGDEYQMAKPNACKQPCDTLMGFSFFVILGGFLVQFMFIPSFLATLRSVDSEDAPLAIGFNNFFVTLLGAVPGPFLFGAIIDATCTITRPACGPAGTCALYDVETMRLHIQGLSTSIRAIAALFYIGALVLGLRESAMYNVKVVQEKPRKV